MTTWLYAIAILATAYGIIGLGWLAVTICIDRHNRRQP
jgi:hypothetical protein